MDDDAVRDALEHHPAIERDDDVYRVTTAELDNEIALAYGELVITITIPDLSEVITDEEPADVVVESWFDSLKRHLVDGYSVTTSEPVADAVVTHGATTVEVIYRLDGHDPEELADDAKALVDFCVGSYLQSAIPGYEYDDPMDGLLGKAWSRGRSTAEDA